MLTKQSILNWMIQEVDGFLCETHITGDTMIQLMTRGKQQILFNYLPGRTFDFDKTGAIAQVNSIRGIPNTDLNLSLILDAIRRYSSTWMPSLSGIFYRPQTDQFVLIDPKKVYSNLFPKIFWCINQSCSKVFNFSNRSLPSSKQCPFCKTGRLTQIRFVKVHRCGEIQPLTPPYSCKKCNSKDNFALDTRGSERVSGFVWKCRICGEISKLYGGYCKACNWQDLTGDTDSKLRQMEIKVHRAGDAYFTHFEVLLNQPTSDISALLNIDLWQAIVAALFLELPETDGSSISDFINRVQETPNTSTNLSEKEVEQLRKKGFDNLQIEQFLKMQTELQGVRQEVEESNSPASLSRLLTAQTGISLQVLQDAGHELLESVLIFQSPDTLDLLKMTSPNKPQQTARLLTKELGISRLSLASDFPITHASFGYSRVKYEPNECRINAFPPDDDHDGKFPIFVDLVQADAIVIQLDSERVWRWLELNSCSPSLPSTFQDETKARKAYFIELLTKTPLRQTLTQDSAQARMVFGLLHTMSHLFVRKAALLCGLDRTSISEYILPTALTFAIYCNHRFGATIGALSSLFEQSLPEWIGQTIDESRRCIYDPVCLNRGANCHACTHLAETSCRFFNLNLSRSFLFGGPDTELGDIKVGFWEFKY